MDEETRPSQGIPVVTLGVDTPLDRHVTVALDRLGRRSDELSVPATAGGYGELLA